MARRIITAREQYEMLSPWRTASEFDPFKVTHRLRDEFHDWFGQQYQQDPTRYSDKQWGAGMSHWPVIEDFLKDKYPAAHRGLMTGREDASALLDYPEASGIMSRYDDETGSDIQSYSSEDHQKLGYDPAEVAAGMVLLHNQNRDGLSNGYLEEDKDRLVDIFNKRQQMQRNYEQRTGATYWHITDNPDFKPDPNHRPENNSTLGGNFDPGLFVSKNPNHWMQGYGYWRPYVSEVDVPDEIGTDFDNSERMIPAEHYDKIKVKRTIPVDAYAREQYNEPGWVEEDTGQDFLSGSPLEKGRGGYSQRNWDGKYSFPGTAMDHPEEWRTNYEQRVRDYQQRTPGIIASIKTAADLAKEYTQQLHDEFHDWAKGADWLEGSKPSDTPDYTKPMGGPLTYWGNIEKFFKDRYPEAYRGFNMAEEKARPLMDNGRATWSAETMRAKPYETGPEAEAKYGYDPKALAAGMMYLHTWSHAQSAQNAWRGDKLPRDIGRLNDIFQKRQQMQRNYEQNQAVTNAPH